MLFDFLEARRSSARSGGRDNSSLGVGNVAGAASSSLGTIIFIASRLLALQLALGLLAVGGLDALVGAIQFLANR